MPSYNANASFSVDPAWLSIVSIVERITSLVDAQAGDIGVAPRAFFRSKARGVDLGSPCARVVIHFYSQVELACGLVCGADGGDGDSRCDSRERVGRESSQNHPCASPGLDFISRDRHNSYAKCGVGSSDAIGNMTKERQKHIND